MQSHLTAALAAATTLLGDRLSTNPAIRDHHGKGQDIYDPVRPDAVAFPHTSAEVAALLAICNRHAIPVTPFGAGTSLEGHVVPTQAGLTIDLSQMTRIIQTNPADMDCRIEAGVTRTQLNTSLRDQGLFFPVDPGSECTIGGMCATRASGTNAVRYGTIRENVLGLTIALPDGSLIRTGGRVRKSATGYDLTHLFIGSEGTLGIITEIQLRLHPIPEATAAAICQFATLSDTVQTVMEIMQSAIPIARIELLDDVMMGACIAYSKLENLSPAPTLLLEFHGSPGGVAEQAAAAQAIAQGWHSRNFTWATDPDERRKLWQARHDGYWAACALRPGHRAIGTDCVVPISRLAEVIIGAKADIDASGLLAPIVGHVGDGNFHSLILVPDEPDGMARALALDHALVNRALDLGGSCSGEHGIGLGKRDYMAREHDAGALIVMRSLKSTLDPRGIMNPGKMFAA